LSIPTGKLTPLGKIVVPLSTTCPPCRMTVTLALDRTPFKNEWNFWVYPPKDAVSPPADVLVLSEWKDALSALREGKKVLFLATSSGLAQTLPGRFTPVFWSPVWFKERPGTMGILCDPKHPALAEFPTAAHSDWQWDDILQRSRTMILDDTPPDFRPIVQVIDNFSRNHRLGCLFEARVGTGKLMACSLKLSEDIGNRPAARQLAESIYHYMGSDRFQPRADLDEARLSKLFAPLFEGVMRRLSAKVVHADSEAQDYPASNVLDGNPETIWHTPWGQGAPGFPHEIVLEFPAPVAMAGCKLLPRQDMRNGWIKDYALYVSSDGKSWGRPGARGAFDRSDEMQTVYLKGRAEAKFMKLVALSAFDGQPFASLAEIEIVQP
jgi:hypothetical protein